MSLNIREDRILQRTFQTLSLEETYALKLLDLDNRQMHLRHRRMKSTVSKIKSYLAPDEIIEMRRLEKEGKLKPQFSGLKVSSAVRIAAAARRLNLGSEKRRALAEQRKRQERAKSSRYSEADVEDLKQHTAWNSIIGGQKGLQDTKGAPENNIGRPVSAYSSVMDRKAMLPLRPSTSNGFTTHKNAQPRRTKSAHLYSSHKEAKHDTAKTRSPSLHRRRGSDTSEISLGSNAAKNQAEDEIDELLEEEELKTMALQNRKHDFVSRVNDWISENPHNVPADNDFEDNLETCINVSGGITRDDITNKAHEAKRKIEANHKQSIRRQFGDGIRKMTLISTAWGLSDSMKQHRGGGASTASDPNDLKDYEFLLNYEDTAARLCRLTASRTAQKETPH